MDIWRKGSIKLLQVVRMLYFCVAKYNINVIVTHIAGVDNAIADALSHFQVTHFQQLAPDAAMHLDTIPAWLALSLRDS